MKIFVLENQVVKPTDEILLVYPFKDIWERDTSKNKEQALREFAYIYFMMDPKKSNPFYGYPEETRRQKLVENLWRKDKSKFIEDELILEAKKIYEEFLYEASVSYSFLKAARRAVREVQDFLENVNLNERTDKGAMVLKPKDVTSALTDSNNVLSTLNLLEEKVMSELFETVKTKGNKDINPFEM